MVVGEASAASERFFAEGPRRIVVLVRATTLQFRHQMFDDIREGLVRHRIRQIEAIDVRVLDPFLEQIRDRRWSADKQRAEPSNSDPVGKLTHRSNAATLDRGVRFQRRSHGVRFDAEQGRVEIIRAEVAILPTREERERERL
jgi:hypothetical protein